MKRPSRLPSFREKMQVFFIGLLLGIILSAGFFLLKIDQYVKELGIVKAITQSDDTPEDAKVLDSAAIAKNQHSHKNNTVKSTEPGSSVEMTSSGSDSTSVSDSARYTQPSGDEDIVVRKEELVSSQQLAVSGTETASKDSSLSKLSGIHESTPVTSMLVEFWRSPLNYKGYKMSRNKIVLFGIGPDDQPSLHRIDDELYLKSSIGVYHLHYAADFRSLERVSDETVLSRIP